MSAAALRTLIAQGRPVVAPGAYDALSGRLAERAGFPCVYMTGYGATASRLGAPDIGLMTQTEMTDQARNFVRTLSVPVIADADTGYGGLSNIHRTIREYVQAGVAAIHLEDQVMPKRCGQMAGVRVVERGEAIERVRCALHCRGSSDLLVVARTDAISSQGEDESIERANAFQQAGADLVFVDGIRSIASCERVGRNVDGLKVISIVDGTEVSNLSVADLTELGYAVVLYPLTALLAAASSVQDALARLSTSGPPPSSIDYSGLNGLVDLNFHNSLDDQFGRTA